MKKFLHFFINFIYNMTYRIDKKEKMLREKLILDLFQKYYLHKEKYYQDSSDDYCFQIQSISFESDPKYNYKYRSNSLERKSLIEELKFDFSHNNKYEFSSIKTSHVIERVTSNRGSFYEKKYFLNCISISFKKPFPLYKQNEYLNLVVERFLYKCLTLEN